MPVSVRIPTPLRPLTGDRELVASCGSTVNEVLDDLEASWPGVKARICDAGGELRRFVNLYLNGEDIRFREGRATAVRDGDEISIIPAIAGG
ncbi:MAG TPA: ubiquitin-like small modifier protein 1 [Vicinamibacteria bacterium]|nr:ubiquitin-like small modifier protein 1 [Vicinamibacteria bacterium]